MLLKNNFAKTILLIFALIFSLFLTSCVTVPAVKKPVEDSVIPIAMALDENYLYPTIVSITSVMENKNLETGYSFYIMHPKNLSENAKSKLLSLQDKYNQCQITLINMENRYKKAHIRKASTNVPSISTPTYYRLSLSELLPKLDKIIWLDGDTLTLYDLNEMFNIDMTGYYYKGFLDSTPDSADEFGIYNDHYICAGVMLINLKELRKSKMPEKFQNFIKENNNRLKQHDQTIINVLCYKKTGILPAKYGIFNFLRTDERILNYVNSLRTSEKYNIEEVKKAVKDPWILHCVLKPWLPEFINKHNRDYYMSLWLEYAKKTNFFEEIINKYSLEEFICE